MPDQNFANHRKIYPLHHLVLLPACIALTTWCAFQISEDGVIRKEWIAITAISFLLTALSVLVRQHYALGNQNRIVRLEMRLRYLQLTGKSFEPLETRLSFGQIAALRFAADEELQPLLDKALSENLSATDIKKSIKSWKADHMRV